MTKYVKLPIEVEATMKELRECPFKDFEGKAITEIEDTVVNAQINKSYVLKSDTFQTVNLPTLCSVGDSVFLLAKGSGKFKVST